MVREVFSAAQDGEVNTERVGFIERGAEDRGFDQDLLGPAIDLAEDLAGLVEVFLEVGDDEHVFAGMVNRPPVMPRATRLKQARPWRRRGQRDLGIAAGAPA